MKLATLACFAVSLSVGCGASMPRPTNELTEAKSAVRGAEEVGAPDVPKAALHLKMARDNIELAEQAIAKENNERAHLYLQRGQADAELAILLAKEARVAAEAQEALDKVEELRRESAAVAQ